MKRVAPTLLVCLAAGLAACGRNEDPADSTPSNGAAVEPTEWQKQAALDNKPTSRGRLEVVDPQNPDRPYFHDFEVVEFGDVIDWDIRMANVGPEAVEILNVQPACGCTQVRGYTVFGPGGDELESREGASRGRPVVVEPSGSVALRMRLISDQAIANQNKLANVRMLTNSAEAPFTTFEIRFIPKRSFLHDRNGLEARGVATSHGGEAKIKLLTPAKGMQRRVLGIAEVPEGFDARVEELAHAGETYWFVYLTIPPLTPIGVQRGALELITTDENGVGDAGRYALPYLVQITPDVIARPGRASFGRVAPAAPARLEFVVDAQVPGASLRVLDSRLEGLPADATVEATPVQPNDAGRSARWNIALTAPTGFSEEGGINAKVELVLDEPFGGGAGDDGTVLVVPILGRVLVADDER